MSTTKELFGQMALELFCAMESIEKWIDKAASLNESLCKKESKLILLRSAVSNLPEECDHCASQPGSPALCRLCLAVRSLRDAVKS